MAINFPDNPTAGDIYTANGRSWQWDGTVWGTYGTQPDPTVLAVDGSNNRVGINTINPTATLDVDGSVVFSGNANIGGSVTIDGDFTVSGTTTTVNTTELNVEDNIVTLNYGVTGTPSLDAGIEVERGDETNAQLLWDESAGAWVVNSDFTVDTSTFHVDSVNDRIGIGTTTPEVNLHIRNSGGAILGAAGTGAGDYAALRLVVGEMNPPRYAAEIIFDDSSYSTTIGTYNNSSTRRDDITIDGATGNVGIGTTTPATALHVEGTVGSNGIVHIVDGATESSIAYKINGSTGNTGWVTGNLNDDYFLYSHTLGGQALTVKPSGNVGVGTTTPSQPFQASGVFDVSSGAIINTGAEEMLLAEHVGSGNPIPFAMRISSSTADTANNFGILHLDRNGAGVGGGSNLHFRRQNSADDWIEYGGVGAQIVDSTNGTEDGQLNFYTTRNGSIRNLRMYLTPEGYVRNPTIPAWHVGLSTTTAFNSGTTPIAWNQSSGDDLFINEVTLNTSNGRITVPVDGYYMVMVYLRTESAVGGNQHELYLRRNSGSFITRWWQDTPTVSSFQHYGPLVAVRYMTAGDFFDVAYDPKGSVSLSAYTNGVCGFAGYLLG